MTPRPSRPLNHGPHLLPLWFCRWLRPPHSSPPAGLMGAANSVLQCHSDPAQVTWMRAEHCWVWQDCFIGKAGVTLTRNGESGAPMWSDVGLIEQQAFHVHCGSHVLSGMAVSNTYETTKFNFQCCKTPLSTPQIPRLERKWVAVFMRIV